MLVHVCSCVCLIPLVLYSESLRVLLITNVLTVKIVGQSFLHMPYTATVRFALCFSDSLGLLFTFVVNFIIHFLVIL